MHRFYLPPERCRGGSLRLDGREAHHALHVLRLKRGERVTVLDGAGNEFLCDVADAAKDSLTLAVKEKKTTPAPACSLTLLVAIPKGKIIEGIIQKAVELGANRIVMTTARRASARNGRASPSKPSSNAARRGCPWWTRRRASGNFFRVAAVGRPPHLSMKKKLAALCREPLRRNWNFLSSARCRRSGGIRVIGFWNFESSMDDCP
jgi:hypothetical protein